MDLRVRRAEEADLATMVAATYKAGVAAWSHILPSPVLETLPFPDRWASAIDARDARVPVLVVEADGDVVGLLDAAVAALREVKFRAATLWTAAENHRPRRIYETAGWRTDGTDRRRTLGGVSFVEVRYRLGLGPAS